jgi:Na+-transporting methylmalonyl-CoA/oxaloacetate decarboxylase gamma subunit
MSGHVVDLLVAFTWMSSEFFGLSDHFWATMLLIFTVFLTDMIILIRYVPVHMGIGKPEDFVPIRHAMALVWARAVIIAGMGLCVVFSTGALINLLTILYCAIAFISAVAPSEPHETKSQTLANSV